MKLALFLTVSCLLPSSSPLPAYQPPYGEKVKPKPFRYEYEVQGTGPGTAFNKKETQDEKGNVFGSVVVSLPDGRIQTTTYNADFYDGYHADVKYDGTAQYPSDNYPTYTQPTLTPVHLQSRPIYTPTSPKPNQGSHNLYRQHSPIMTRPNKSPFRHHQNHPLQQQFKSLETIIPEPVDTAQARPEQVIFHSDKIKPVIIPAESSRSQAQNNNKLQQSGMVEIMKNIRDDLKKENKPPMLIPHNSDNTMFVKTNIKNSNAIAQDMKKKVNLNLINSHTSNHKKSKEQTLQPKPLSPSNTDRMEEIMKKIREDLNKNGEPNKSEQQPNLKANVPSFKVEKMQRTFHSNSAVAPINIKMSSKPDGMAEIMKQVRQDLKDLHTEPVIAPNSNPMLEEAETSISMAKTMKNIRDKLKETGKMSNPLIQTKVKTQEKTFEAVKLSPISGPLESFQILEQTPSDTPTEKKMKEIMKNIRKDLIKTEKTKSVSPSESSKPIFSSMQSMQSSKNHPDSETGSMSEIMKRIREDLKNINKEPIIIPQSNNNFIETNKDRSDSKGMREKLQTSKLIKTPAKPQNAMFQNKTIVPTKPDKMQEIMTKIREDLKKNEAIKPLRFPSVNPETPPLMIIKSHIIPEPEIKENLPAVLTIKSNVLSSPPAAESMEDMMEKIRQDLTRQDTSSTEVPFAVSGGMMGIVEKIRKNLDKEEDSKDSAGMGILNKSSTNKPLTDSVVEFMKTVELMKEKENKSTINTMQVKTKVIKHGNSDLVVLPRALPKREESINQLRY